ncbi:hypothetical protein TL16_g05142, partial [Triparma laevis f. inornata]
MVALSLLKIAAGFFLSSSPEFLADRISNLPDVNDEGGVLTVGGSNPCTAGETYDPLDCWLYNLTIPIPDPDPIEVTGLTIILKELEVKRFYIGDITSSYNSAGSYSIDMGVTDLKATASGHFEIDIFHSTSIPYTGRFTASIGSDKNGNPSSIGLTISFLPNENGYMAKSGNTSNVFTPIHIDPDSFEFTDLNVDILNLIPTIVPYIASSFDSSIEEAIEGLISEKVGPSITSILLQADEVILGVVGNTESKDPPLPEDDLVDWEDAGRVEGLMRKLNEFLNEHIDGDGSTGFLTDNGAIYNPFNFSFTLPIDGLADLTIGLTHLNISGLDTLTNVTLFKPTNAHSLTTGVGMEAFNFSVGIEIDVEPVSGGKLKGNGLKESFDVGLNLRHIDILARLLLAVEKDSLRNLTIFQILNPEERKVDWTCAFSTMYMANLTSLSAVMELRDLYLKPTGEASLDSSSLENELDTLIDNLLSLFVGDYNQLVTDTIYGVLQGPLRTTLNKIIYELVMIMEAKAGGKPCRDAIDPETTNSSYFHFDESKIIDAAQSYINDNFGVDGVNDGLECVAELITESGVLAGEIFHYEGSGIVLSVRDLTVGRPVGNFYDLQVMYPELDHYHLHNEVGFAECAGKDSVNDPSCSALRVGVTVDVEYDKQGINDSFNVSVALGDVWMNLGFHAQWDNTVFGALQLGQMNEPACWVSPIEEVGFNDEDMSLGAFEAQIHAKLMSLKKEPHRLDKVINGTQITGIVQQAVKGLFSSAVDAVNGYADDAIYGAPYVCAGEPIPPSPSPSPKSGVTPLYMSGLAMVIYAALVILGVFVYMQKYRGRKRSNTAKMIAEKKGRTASNDLNYAFYEDDGEKPLLDRVGGSSLGTNGISETEESETSVEIDWEDSLMFSKDIPWFIRFALPTTLCCTLACFLSANIGIGASVGMKLSSGGHSQASVDLFSFTLANSVHDMWEAGVYPLSIMIAVFSGGWPYLKVLLMLFAWVSPTQLCSKEKRENLLMWLDALGKYSLVDAYVLVMMMVAFRFHIALQDDSIVADVLVTPEWGFYGFLLATMTSLALGHIILAFHRHAVADYIIPEVSASESLMAHVFQTRTGSKFMLRKITRFITAFTIVFAITFLYVGVYTQSFNFQFEGAAGLALKPPIAPTDTSTASYSVISLGSQIPQSVENPDDFGIRWIEVTYYMFALFMPFTCLIVMLIMFLVPLSIKAQSRFFVLAEITNAWSAMEVVVLSVVAALLEIQQFAAFIIGSKCDAINAIIAKIPEIDQLLDGNDKCFDVQATLGPESFFLFSGAIVSCVVSWGMLRMGHTALGDRVGASHAGGNFVEYLYSTCVGRCLFAAVVEDGERHGDYGKLSGAEDEGQMDAFGEKVILEEEENRVKFLEGGGAGAEGIGG